MSKLKDAAPLVTDESVANEGKSMQTKSGKTGNPAKERGGICVYLGPTIHGAITKGTVFDTDKKTALEKNKDIIKKYPLIEQLIVPGENLPEARIKVKTPGNLLYSNYGKLAGMIKGGKANG